MILNKYKHAILRVVILLLLMAVSCGTKEKYEKISFDDVDRQELGIFLNEFLSRPLSELSVENMESVYVFSVYRLAEKNVKELSLNNDGTIYCIPKSVVQQYILEYFDIKDITDISELNHSGEENCMFKTYKFSYDDENIYFACGRLLGGGAAKITEFSQTDDDTVIVKGYLVNANGSRKQQTELGGGVYGGFEAVLKYEKTDDECIWKLKSIRIPA